MAAEPFVPHDTRLTTDDVAKEWDRLAVVRYDQLHGGQDLSFNFVLKPTILALTRAANVSRFRTLDVGCGTGVLTSTLAELCPFVDGIDPSSTSVAVARSHSKESNLRYFTTSVEQYSANVSKRYGLAVANMTLQTCVDLTAALSAIRHLLSDNGVFVATITHPAFWPRYSGYESEPWFTYSSELQVRSPFRISLEQTDYITTHIHRPLSYYFDALSGAGFTLDKVVEPMPIPPDVNRFPQPWLYPRFLAFSASVGTGLGTGVAG